MAVSCVVDGHYKTPMRQPPALHYDVPRSALSIASPSVPLPAAAAVETTDVAERLVGRSDGITSDIGDHRGDTGQLFTSRDRADVTMTSQELRALLTE